MGTLLLGLSNLTDDELYKKQWNNMDKYAKEFNAPCPSGDGYTEVIRWAIVLERAVVAKLKHPHDPLLRKEKIWESWVTSMMEYCEFIEEKYPSGCSYYEALWRTLC